MTTRQTGKSDEDANQEFASERSNGFGRFAGTWTDEEHRQFEENTASLEDIDAEMWTDDPL
jgi:hypothetical protein